MSAASDLRRRRRACLRHPRHPAAQRVHLFQVLMSAAASRLLRLLGASAAIMLAAAALNYVVDPLQLLRPATLLRPMYSDDVRMQNAGLIRSQDFDTVFMGTSLAIH